MIYSICAVRSAISVLKSIVCIPLPFLHLFYFPVLTEDLHLFFHFVQNGSAIF